MHSWIGRPKLAMLVLSGWRRFAKRPWHSGRVKPGLRSAIERGSLRGGAAPESDKHSAGVGGVLFILKGSSASLQDDGATSCDSRFRGHSRPKSRSIFQGRGNAMMTFMLAGLPPEQLRVSRSRGLVACGGRPSERAWALIAALAAIAVPLILAMRA